MLTDAALRKIKPSGKTVRLFDGGGMYLEVAPAGGRWWRLKYRFGGKEKRLSLGIYPDVGLKDARARRDDARKLLASGVDPSDNRKAARAAGIASAANSFETVAREWYDRNSPTWAPNHSKRVLRLFERDVFPWIGAKPIAAVTSPELLTILRRVEEREAVDTAHRARGTCGQVFRFAIATGRAERDPSTDLRGALAPVVGRHFAAVTEPARVGELLRVLAGYRGTPVVSAALRLAPLVFVRPGELRAAKWSDIDLEHAEWRFTPSKTGTPHVVPLSSQAASILKSLQPITGRGTFVFPSARSDARPMSDNAVLAALRRMGVDKEEMSGHGFRAMARTILDEVLGFRPDFIEHQLGHAVRDPNGRAYNRTAFLAERRQMMQAWSDYLDGVRSEVAIPSKSVSRQIAVH